MHYVVMGFGNKIKKLRSDKGLNQTELAKWLSVNKSIISAYECEQRMPSLDLLIKLSYEFGVSVEYLLGIKRNKIIDVSNLTDEQINSIISVVNQFKSANKK